MSTAKEDKTQPSNDGINRPFRGYESLGYTEEMENVVDVVNWIYELMARLEDSKKELARARKMTTGIVLLGLHTILRDAENKYRTSSGAKKDEWSKVIDGCTRRLQYLRSTIPDLSDTLIRYGKLPMLRLATETCRTALDELNKQQKSLGGYPPDTDVANLRRVRSLWQLLQTGRKHVQARVGDKFDVDNIVKDSECTSALIQLSWFLKAAYEREGQRGKH